MNILKMHGTTLCSMGMAETPNDPAMRRYCLLIGKNSIIKNVLFDNDRLVGAILIGDKTEFIEFKALIENKIELSEKRLALVKKW